MVKNLKNGDEESFDILFEQYSKKIFTFAFRMCGNREDAEDIVQNTFIQAFTHIKGFRGESGVYTWLFSIARNLCLKLIGDKKKASFSDMEALIFTARSACPDSFTALEKQDYIDQVKDGCLLGLLRCLSFYQRISFILNVLLGMNIRNVACVIGKSETAARLLVFRAKQNLKSFMCKNCSLYDSGNPCHCENLIDFSIKQGWIKANGKSLIPRTTNAIRQIEHDLDSLKKIILIYDTLEDDETADKVLCSLKEEIKNRPLKIFLDKKVK